MATPTPPPGSRARQSTQSSAVEALPPVPPPPVPEEATPTDSPRPPTPTRRGSFGFLKRGKSVERMNSRRSNSSGNKLTKRQVKEAQLAAQREAAALPKEPPQIPRWAVSPPLDTFDGTGDNDDRGISGDGQETARSATALSRDSRSTPYGVPIPLIPGKHKGAYVDPYDPTLSMANRARSSYASSTASTINSPRRVRKRNDPTPFNVLVIGSRNSGKTAFIHFLCTALAPRPRKGTSRKDDLPAQVSVSKYSSSFVSHYLETELDDGETIALTIWDSEGFEGGMVDLQVREITGFVESKFEETLKEEIKVVRSPGVRDTHIHAVFFLLDPIRLDQNITVAQKRREKSANGHFADGHSYVHPPSPVGLDIGSLDAMMDLAVLKSLQGKTTVIPVISKADTIPQDHVLELRRSVGESLKQADIDPLENLGLDEQDEDNDQDSSDSSPIEGKSRLHKGGDRSEHFATPNETASDDNNDDISNQSVLNLSSSSSSGRSSTTSVAEPPAEKGKSKKETVLFLPHTVISPYPVRPHKAIPGQVGRRFAWGFADPYNSDHCDFVKLKDAVFSEWRTELREASKELWYENWRTTRLGKAGTVVPRRDLSGPPTTGRGARMGAQIQATLSKDDTPAAGKSPASGIRDQARHSGQPPAQATHGQDRAGSSPARAPHQQWPRLSQSPARGPHEQGRHREYSPAAMVGTQAARVGRSPAGGSREHLQPTGYSSTRGSYEVEQRAAPPAARKPSSEQHAAHHAGHGNGYAINQPDLHTGGPATGYPLGEGPPAQRSRGLSADDRNKQVPWPLQS